MSLTIYRIGIELSRNQPLYIHFQARFQGSSKFQEVLKIYNSSGIFTIQDSVLIKEISCFYKFANLKLCTLILNEINLLKPLKWWINWKQKTVLLKTKNVRVI